MVPTLILFWSASVALAVAHSWGVRVAHHNRRVACLGLRDEPVTRRHSEGETQNQRTMLEQRFSSQYYYSKPNIYYAWFQRHLKHAPLFKTRRYNSYAFTIKDDITRHEKTILVYGFLPGRLLALYMLLYLAVNINLCLVRVDWTHRDDAAKNICKRTGRLCVLNLIPLFLLIWRNNIALRICGVSDFTRVALHRWCGRLVVTEAICHSVAYILSVVWDGGTFNLLSSLEGDRFLIWGMIASLACCVVLVQSIAAIRHALYETFYYLHIGLASVILVAIWFHGMTGKLPGLVFVQTATFIWLVEIALRVSNIVFRNSGPGSTVAEVIPTKDYKVTLISLAVGRPWDYKRGQHLYLTIPKVGWLTQHPFSIAWIDDEGEEIRIILLVRRFSGFTKHLQKALGDEKRPRTFSAIIQGPFGLSSFDSYGNVMFFASGVGITPHLMQIQHLQESRLRRTSAVLQIRLYWYVGSLDLLEVVRPWIKRLVDGQEYPEDILRIRLWAIDKGKGADDISSPPIITITYETLEYRQVKEAITKQLKKEKGATAVSVCGSGRFMDMVCDVVRKAQKKWNVDIYT